MGSDWRSRDKENDKEFTLFVNGSPHKYHPTKLIINSLEVHEPSITHFKVHFKMKKSILQLYAKIRGINLFMLGFGDVLLAKEAESSEFCCDCIRKP